MCSTLETRLAILRAAIDEVATAVRAGQPGHVRAEDLAERLAGLWAMIAALDPALAARLRGYGPDNGLSPGPHTGPGSLAVIMRTATGSLVVSSRRSRSRSSR
jgi:hypothetical protein